MTLNDLKNEVTALSFDTELYSHDAFVFALNRALLELHAERERCETKRFYKRRVAPTAHYEHLFYKGGEDITLSLAGAAFSFIPTGSGELQLTDGEKCEFINFSSTDVEIKKKINTGVAFLRFKGELDYEIRSLAAFDALHGEGDDGIPVMKPFYEIDLKISDPRFLAFSAPVKNEREELIFGAVTEGSRVLIPNEYEGEIKISYKRLPRKIEADELDAAVDVSPETEHLLPLRIAAYLLLDDNRELSEYYLSLYKSGLSALRANTKSTSAESYSDVLRWA